MRKSIHKAVSLIMILLLLQSCTSTKYIYSKNDPTRIPSKMKKQDLNKIINIFQEDTLYERGKIIEFNEMELKISREETTDTLVINFSNIDKVSLEHKEVPLPFFLLVIGIVYYIASIGNFADQIPTE